MTRENNIENPDWIEFFQNIEKIMTSKNWPRSAMFETIETHFKSKNKRIAAKTLYSKYQDYKDHGLISNKTTISSVSIAEINEYLRTEFAGDLNNEFDFDTFDYHYIYYYQCSQDYIKPSILCFKNDGGEWGEGVIYYLTKAEHGYKHSSTFNLERLLPYEEKRRYQKFLFYKAISEDLTDQVNMFTFNTSEKPVEKRFLFFLNCNAISYTNQGRAASINVGVAKKIEKQSILNEIQSAIDPWITNALFGKRFTFGDLESSVFATKDKFLSDKHSDNRSKTTNLEYTSSKIVKGYYMGVYLRNEIPALEIVDNGGIAFVIMQIFEDGNASINFLRSSNKDEIVTYLGIFHFPYDDYKEIKGDFQMEKPQIYRFSIFLNELGDPNKFGGIFSGFKNKSPFASPIIFYKLHINSGDLNTLIKKYNPGRINKHEISEFFKSAFGNRSENMLSKIKDELFKLSKEYLETPENCFPEN